MGWQDAPLVKRGGWADAPLVKKPETSMLDRIPFIAGPSLVEPVMAMGDSVVRTIAGGIAGGTKALLGDPEGGAEQLKKLQEGAYTPQTQGGQENLNWLMSGMNKVSDAINYPLSGVTGATDLVARGMYETPKAVSQVPFVGPMLAGYNAITNQESIDNASQRVEDVQDVGFSKELSEGVYRATGSPLAATVAETTPPAVAMMLGARQPKTMQETKTALAPIHEVPRAFMSRQSPAKREIANMIMKGTPDARTAPYMLETSQPSSQIARTVQQSVGGGVPLITGDTVAKEAIRQGFKKGEVASVKFSSAADKQLMKEMLDIMENARNNEQYAMSHRPSDVVGRVILRPFNELMQINKQAASQLDEVAKSLTGQQVNYSPAVNKFMENLADLGIGFDENLNPVYQGSLLEGKGMKKGRNVINNIISRMRDTQVPDAYDVHRLKRYIDENVSYGKAGQGLAGRSEGIVKQLRHDLNEILKQQFPNYAEVNTTYSQTIQVLDELQKTAGTKVDLTGEYAETALGTMARKIGSNYQSRVSVLKAIEDIQKIRNQQVGKTMKRLPGSGMGENNYKALVVFANTLDGRFGHVGRNTFQGQIEQAQRAGKHAATGNVKEAAVDIGMNAIDKMRGVNDEAAFRAMKKLLEQ